MLEPREQFMRSAISEAAKARRNNDYAIGAVIVKDDVIISSSPNITRTRRDPTRHAEIEAMRQALSIVADRFLEGCVLYTTHEPCPMCATAAVWVKLNGIVFGSYMSDIQDYAALNANDQWKWRTVTIPAKEVLSKGYPRVDIVGGFLRKECLNLFHS